EPLRRFRGHPQRLVESPRRDHETDPQRLAGEVDAEFTGHLGGQRRGLRKPRLGQQQRTDQRLDGGGAPLQVSTDGVGQLRRTRGEDRRVVEETGEVGKTRGGHPIHLPLLQEEAYDVSSAARPASPSSKGRKVSTMIPVSSK